VLVGLSGGVESVTAYLLQQQGYEVIGLFYEKTGMMIQLQFLMNVHG
jgi:tRNA U34 2-thiouridine synthase MnmA/TrmU